MTSQTTNTADRIPMQEKRGLPWLWLLLGLLLLAALIIGLLSLLGGDDDDKGRKIGTTSSGKAVYADQLGGDDFSKYEGKTVTITEEIDDPVSQTAFTLGGDTDKFNIPVVGITPDMYVDSKPVNAKQTRVRVTGKVVDFGDKQVQDQYGADFKGGKYKDLKDGAGIVASKLDIDPADDGGKGEANGDK